MVVENKEIFSLLKADDSSYSMIFIHCLMLNYVPLWGHTGSKAAYLLSAYCVLGTELGILNVIGNLFFTTL